MKHSHTQVQQLKERLQLKESALVSLAKESDRCSSLHAGHAASLSHPGLFWCMRFLLRNGFDGTLCFAKGSLILWFPALAFIVVYTRSRLAADLSVCRRWSFFPRTSLES